MHEGSCAWFIFFFFQAEDGIRDLIVTGVQTCALPICSVARSRAGVDLPDRERATEPRTDLGREEGAEALDLRLAGGRLGDDAGAQGHAELAQHGLSAAASRAARAAARATWSACPRGGG